MCGRRMIGRYKNESTVNVVSKVEEIAKRKGVSMARVAVAWVLSKRHVTAPIVGTTSLGNLEDILGERTFDISAPVVGAEGNIG